MRPPDSLEESDEEQAALALAAAGDTSLLGSLLQSVAPRLARIVTARLDARLIARVDAEDVVQDVFALFSTRLPDYLEQRETESSGRLPLFLWLRVMTREAVIGLHRHHLGAGVRDAGRERRHAPASAGATSVHLAHLLASEHTTPTGALARSERDQLVAASLERLKETDREVLVLRHFEDLSNKEVARVLGLTESGASLRHLRALKRLKDLADIDTAMPGGSRSDAVE